jgi:hypothetical protein
MAGTMLATMLAAGLAAQGWDGSGDGVRRSIEDLKRSVEQLRKQQQEQQVGELKQKISELRSERTDQKIDELRRILEERPRHHPWVVPGHRGRWAGWMPRMPRMPRAAGAPPNRAVVRVSVPRGATLIANDREVPVSSPAASSSRRSWSAGRLTTTISGSRSRERGGSRPGPNGSPSPPAQ